MGADDLGIKQGGSGCPDIGTDLLGNGAITLTIRFKYMGPDTAYEVGLGWIPP